MRPTPLTDHHAGIPINWDGDDAAVWKALSGWIDFARQLERDRAELMEALKECVEDLACEVTGRYVSTMDHPAIKPKFECDMKPVYKSRALLARLTEGK